MSQQQRNDPKHWINNIIWTKACPAATLKEYEYKYDTNTKNNLIEDYVIDVRPNQTKGASDQYNTSIKGKYKIRQNRTNIKSYYYIW